MEQRDARRAEELANLKLALATFALQLDAFEVLTSAGQGQRRMHGPSGHATGGSGRMGSTPCAPAGIAAPALSARNNGISRRPW